MKTAALRRMVPTVICATLVLVAPVLVHAQSMFLDANNDGVATANDSINTGGATTLRVWLRTDANISGVPSGLSTQYGESLTVNSYEIILHCTGGKVSWGEFVNSQPTMNVHFGTKFDETEYYVGYGGPFRFPPGKYLLGSITFKVVSGRPSVTIVPKSHLDPVFQTAFGSRCPGKRGSNTLVLGDSASTKLSDPSSADWYDVRGVLADTDPARAAALKGEAAEVRVFYIRRIGGPAAASLRLVISTTRPGPVRADLFDVAGRRVARLIDESDAIPAVRSVPMIPPGRRLANGVYFYKVVTGEGHQEGKFVLLR